MKNGDQRIYKTFEEFEREELRRADGGSMDEYFASGAFTDELDFEPPASRRGTWDDDEDE
jgi:hypothetical protein